MLGDALLQISRLLERGRGVVTLNSQIISRMHVTGGLSHRLNSDAGF